MRIFPRSLKGQLILLTVAGLLLTHTASYLVIIRDQQTRLKKEWLHSIFARVMTISDIMDTTPADFRDAIVRSATTPWIGFSVDHIPNSDGIPNVTDDEKAELSRVFANRAEKVQVTYYEPFYEAFTPSICPGLYREIGRWLGFNANPSENVPPKIYATVSVRLKDGYWMNAVVSPQAVPISTPTLLIQFFIMAVIASLGVVFVLSRVIRPLRDLAEASVALGHRQSPSKLEEKGPQEVLDTIRAFNEMQDKLSQFMQDRTKMLAALGHDLRTPITTLRLRAEFIEDDETREKVLCTLAEMLQMTESALAFAKGGELDSLEEPRLVDLGALVSSVCDDLSDTGSPVECIEAMSMTLRCRPFALRRALRNVIVNAVAYGSRAQVSMALVKDEARIIIEDDGPGIPAEDRENVFAPFVRLENSRNADTGGMGLGLAIARGVVRFHGGDVLLENREQSSGLRVTIALPGAKVREKERAAMPTAPEPEVA